MPLEVLAFEGGKYFQERAIRKKLKSIRKMAKANGETNCIPVGSPLEKNIVF